YTTLFRSPVPDGRGTAGRPAAAVGLHRQAGDAGGGAGRPAHVLGVAAGAGQQLHDAGGTGARRHPPVLAPGAVARRFARTGRPIRAARADARGAEPPAGDGRHGPPPRLRRGHGPGRIADAGIHPRHRHPAAGTGSLRRTGAGDAAAREDPVSTRERKPLLRRIVPSLPLAVTVFVFWLLMNSEVSVGHALMGLLLALAIPPFAARLDREFARIGRISGIPRMLCVLALDVVRSNITVARQVL